MTPIVSVREKQIIHLLANGHTNKEISTTLDITTTTVKSHISRILSKLRLRNRTELAAFAFRTGIIQP